MQFEQIHELTPVFPPDVLPVRSGVYWTQELDAATNDPVDDWKFSYFDATDRIWGCSSGSIYVAAHCPEYEFASQHKKWRGITEEATK